MKLPVFSVLVVVFVLADFLFIVFGLYLYRYVLQMEFALPLSLDEMVLVAVKPVSGIPDQNLLSYRTPGPEVIKTIFILNSNEHKNSTARKK